MSLLNQLEEARRCLLKCILIPLGLFFPLAYFARSIYDFFNLNVISILPENTQIIATDIKSTFFVPIKLCLWLSIFLSVPFIIYNIWKFVSPALYNKEKRYTLLLVSTSTLLFYLGASFAYLAVIPFVFKLLILSAPSSIVVYPDMQELLNFVFFLMFVFGIAFEAPIIVSLLCFTGLIAPDTLKKSRKYILVGCFFVSMLLTPPDIFSQILLAIPLYLLLEIGIISSVIVLKFKKV